MKKLILSLTLAISLLNGIAQESNFESRIEITGFTGYQTSGTINFYQGKFKAKDGQNWGGILGFRLRPSTMLEVSWTQTKNDFIFRPYAGYGWGTETIYSKGSTNFYLIGGTQEQELGNEKILGLAGFSVGACNLNFDDVRAKDTWEFAMGVNLGVKVFLTDRIGLRFQGRLLMPMYFNGISVGCGVGTGGAGCGTGVSTTAVLIEGDFTGGILIAI